MMLVRRDALRGVGCSAASPLTEKEKEREDEESREAVNVYVQVQFLDPDGTEFHSFQILGYNLRVPSSIA